MVGGVKALARLAAVLGLWTTLAGSQESSFVGVWLDQGQAISEAQVESVLSEVSRREARPDHIAVVVHGYDTPREVSSEEFQGVGERLLAEYRACGQKVVVVGLQWESAVPGSKLPWKAEEAYLDMVARARQVGHGPARQVLLALQERFPQTSLSYFGHSLGCEVGAACVFPEMEYPDEVPKSPVFEEKKDLTIDLLALLGSDLDYDCWFKGEVRFRTLKPRVRLFWMTMSGYFGDRDKTLQIRQMSRGFAGGAAFPRMTEDQYDNLFNNRAVVFDHENIPRGHELVRYLDGARLHRMVPAAVFCADTTRPEPDELRQLDAILALPRTVEALQPWLDSDNLSSQIYALWRLEVMLCGGSMHFSDETLENVTRLLRNSPRRVWGEREESPCQGIRRGYWPTEAQMTRAGAPSWSR